MLLNERAMKFQRMETNRQHFGTNQMTLTPDMEKQIEMAIKAKALEEEDEELLAKIAN